VIAFSKAVAKAVEGSRPDMDARAHHFTADIGDDIWVNADETRLVQIIQNLLGNATKFTPNGGSIRLTARVDDRRLHVSIADSGVGIEPASMDSIFELFSQGDGVAASRQSGLGIGLSLARSLVEMHGGSISASSAGAGHGSVFSFELPGALVKPSPAPEDGAQDTSTGTGQVLVVDDNRDAADSLSEILRLLGYQVRTAYDGASAVRAAQQLLPDALFMDMAMPDMSGPEVMRLVRQLPGGEAVYACAVTGFSAEDEKAGRADFTDFNTRILKPAELVSLRAVLEAAKLA
ncbi:MAG: response regulator, partial [Burkholderiales bacterium]